MTRRAVLLPVLVALPAVAICLLAFCLPARAQEDPGAPAFRAVHLTVDAGDAELAAWQVLFTGGDGVTVVGVEGGEHPAFAEPPVYDPEALRDGRLALAAFTTGDDLPTGATRVATIHLRIAADAAPNPDAVLQAAGDPDGARIPARLTWTWAE